MRLTLKSIHFQVLFSFLMIILITLIISTVIEYYSYAAQLPRLFTEIRSKSIAGHLSSTYTRDQSWDNLNFELQRLNNLESLNTLEDAALRIIVKDSEGRTLYNSFSNITQIGNDALIEGESQPIVDFKTSETVGKITIYISRHYIISQSRVYVLALLNSAVYKGLLTAGIAFIVSILISRRLTLPVISLTEAAQSIAREGKSKRILISSSDELGRLSSAFNSMLSSLENQRALRKKLITDVSHEINTPLTAIRLEARGLSDGLVSADEAGMHIMDEIDKLRNVVYDLEWLSETDSGSYNLKREEYQLSKLVSDEMKRWEHKARAMNKKLIAAECPDSLPKIELDVIRISTVLGNLIENAIKYAPSGSTLTISCRQRGTEAVTSVCDDGPPIAPEHRPYLFERFYHAGIKDDKQISGRGLGLSIVKQIIELHGGKVWLDCGEERGNCFFFTLPVFSD